MTKLILKDISLKIKNMLILKNISAIFLPGKITALIGPNGAGKTTLFHVITGELKPNNGKVLLNNKDITSFPPHKIAQLGIGRLFQDIRIFRQLTVYENLASVCYNDSEEMPYFPFLFRKKLNKINKEIKDKVEYYANLVELSKKLNSYAEELSFGQQKLLAIARLLIGNFNILLLDEPVAGIDPGLRKKILNMLDKLIINFPDKIIIIVEHNMKAVSELADWVYFMNDGEITFFGRTDHVLGDKSVKELYLGL